MHNSRSLVRLCMHLCLVLTRLKLLISEEGKGGTNQHNGVNSDTEAARLGSGFACIGNLLGGSLWLWVSFL